MKKAGILTVACVVLISVTGSTVAELEGEMGNKRGRSFENYRQCGGGGWKHGGKLQEAMFGRIVNDPKLAEEIGLSEEQIDTLKKARYDLKKQEIQLKAEKKIAAMEQAKLMTESTIDEDAVMEAVEESGQIATEIAKVRIKQLLLVKKTLTPEQIEKVKDLICSRKKEWLEKKHRGGNRGDRKGGDFQRERVEPKFRLDDDQ